VRPTDPPRRLQHLDGAGRVRVVARDGILEGSRHRPVGQGARCTMASTPSKAVSSTSASRIVPTCRSTSTPSRFSRQPEDRSSTTVTVSVCDARACGTAPFRTVGPPLGLRRAQRRLSDESATAYLPPTGRGDLGPGSVDKRRELDDPHLVALCGSCGGGHAVQRTGSQCRAPSC
jgi:hypothetical protein